MDEDEILNARQVAEQNPELDATRRQLFGENYLQDIDQGTGIAQYYTGFGQMPTLDYTPPVVEEAAPAVDVTQPIVDTGGDGGGGGIDISTGNETGNTDFEYQGTPGGNTGSGEFDLIDNSGKDYGPYTQTTDTIADAPPSLGFGNPPTTLMDDREQYGAVGQYEPYTQTTDTIADAPPSLGFGNPPTTLMDDREQYGAQGQYEDYVNPADVEAGLATESMFDTPEQTNAINEAFNSVKDLGAAGVDKLRDSLVALGGKVKEGFDNTIEIGGKTIDLGKSLLGGAISLATGIPGVGFLLNAVQEDPVDIYNQSLFSADNYLNSDIYKADKDMTDQEYSEYKNRLGGYYGDLRAGNLEGQDPFGKNITSAFGDYEAMAQDIVDKVSSIPVNERTQFQKDQLDFYGDVVKDTPAPQEDIGATDSMASINMQEARDITNRLDDEITDGSDLRGDPYGGGQTGVQSGLSSPTDEFSDDEFMAGDTSIAAPATGDTASDSFFDAADNAATSSSSLTNAQVEANIDAARGGGGGSSGTLSQAQSTANIDAARGGGSGSGGGGKIVCTMMNNSYGFGSFRNKIWLKHSRDMKPEYQKGYHKIFLPLVKLSKTNKVLKKTLEHIAVHRTIDIRQEARGKVHLLGRVYRKILEPICYVVGKYVK